eukprot:jgi/Orpsp1_1/1189762/evm.model.d7180000074271.1
MNYIYIKLFLFQLLSIVLSGKVTWSKFSNIDARALVENASFNFYNQLNDIEIKIYNGILENCLKPLPEISFTITISEIKNITDVTSNINLFFEKANTAVVLENPEIWWFISPTFYLKKKTSTSVTLEYTMFTIYSTIYVSNENIKNMNQEITNEKDKIMKEISDLGLKTDYGKLRFIHDYLITNIYNINDNSDHSSTLYGALVKKRCFSNGFSNAFQYLSRQYGINCIIIRGNNYGFNYVELDGKWYIVDVCADDPEMDGNVLEVGKNKNLKYDYFLVGSNYTEPNGEIITNESKYTPKKSIYGIKYKWINYPELETTDYSPNEEEIEDVNKFTLYKER